MVELLCEQLDVNLEEKNHDGYNALHLACRVTISDGCIGAVKILIQHKSFIHVKDIKVFDAFLTSCAIPIHEIAKFLLPHGANLFSTNDYGLK